MSVLTAPCIISPVKFLHSLLQISAAEPGTGILDFVGNAVPFCLNRHRNYTTVRRIFQTVHHHIIENALQQVRVGK
ncbi:hypothetical protein D3C73_1474830 [compost metagenome]